MKIEAGEILNGKVTGIAKFGAFVELAPGKSGLVYISEISNTYVKDVSDFLAVGQEVTVKVVSVDSSGRINLSIKQAAPEEPVYQKSHGQRQQAPVQKEHAETHDSGRTEAPVQAEVVAEPSGDQEFEDKLKRFMKDSDSRLSDINKRQGERRSSKHHK